MPSEKPGRRFADIVENVDRIHRFVSGMSYDDYLSDDRTRYAVERAFQIIAEAASKLGSVAEEMCPDQPWLQIRAFGNVLRHDYDRLSDTLVWETIGKRLPSLRADCLKHAEN